MINRFEVVRRECIDINGWNFDMVVFVLRDKDTGIMYLVEHFGNSGGITPLLDKDGKPMIALR